ncbi:MAG: hypothetical protein VX599_02105 [Pseudomonadota bacterium]|nr:hypothetical protein [Pseudomonadota bacterium]
MKHILATLFPKQITNTYPGQKIALFVFVPLTLMLTFRSCMHLVAPDGGAQSIATIPLDTYSAGAAANVIAIFSQWGLSQLLLTLLFILVLVRYRSLIPLFYLIFAVEMFGRMAVGHFKPVVTLETAPGASSNMPLLIAALIMLGLSLMPSKSGAVSD